MAGTSGNTTRVNGVATSIQLLPANGNRYAAPGSVSVVIVNDSTAIMYVLLGDPDGTHASATNYTYQLTGNAGGVQTREIIDFRGPIGAVWASAAGAAQVTEIL